MTAVENAEEHEDTPEDEAVDGEDVQVVQGKHDCGSGQQDETQDVGGVAVPIQCEYNVPRTQLDSYHVQEQPPDSGGDEEEHFLDAKIDSSLHDKDNCCVEEEQVLDVDD